MDNLLKGTLTIALILIAPFVVTLVVAAFVRLFYNMNLKNEVLALADRRLGRLTVLKAAKECETSPNQAKKILDYYLRQGHCTVEVNENGTIMYVFADFLPTQLHKSNGTYSAPEQLIKPSTRIWP